MHRIYSAKGFVVSDTTVFARYGEMIEPNDKRGSNLRRSVSWND